MELSISKAASTYYFKEGAVNARIPKKTAEVLDRISTIIVYRISDAIYNYIQSHSKSSGDDATVTELMVNTALKNIGLSEFKGKEIDEALINSKKKKVPKENQQLA